MPFVERTLAVQRGAVAAVLASSALVFWRGSYDVFNTPKATLVALLVLTVMAVGAVRVSRTRRLLLPDTPLWAAVGVFAVGLVVATVVSDSPLQAVVGDPGRHTGLAMYLIYAVLLLSTVRLFRDRPGTVVVRTLLVTAVPVAGYGLLQAVGVEPFDWRVFEAGPQVVSTFGNANFLAAWLGVVVPLAAGAAALPTWPAAWRAAAAAVALLAFAVAAASGSLQGVTIAAVGSAFVAGVAGWSRGGRARRLLLPAAVAVTLVAAGVVALMVAGAGPLEGVRQSAALSVSTRVDKWVTAWRMLADHPLTGVGLAGFGDRFNLYRPVDVAAESGLLRSVDDPHDVPLAMFVSGGPLLGTAYLAIVWLTGRALVRGLRARRGPDLLELGALGGGWLAYQVQSLVSIDVPPLATLHWVLAGLVVARAARPPLREVALPGAPTATPARQRRGTPAVRLAPWSPGQLAVIALVTLAAAAVVVTPLRADLAAGRAESAAAAGQAQSAVDAYEQASAVASWEGLYPALQAGYLTELRRYGLARERHREAAAREPHALVHRINVGRLSVALGEIDAAAAAYGRALELDPKTPEVLAEVGEFELEHGDRERAVRLLQRAVQLRPANATWEQLLARARTGG